MSLYCNELLKICHRHDQVIWFSSQKVTEKWLELNPGARCDGAKPSAAPALAPSLLYIQKSKLKALNKVKINALIYPTLCSGNMTDKTLWAMALSLACWWQQAGLAPAGDRGTVAPEATRHCPKPQTALRHQPAVAAASPTYVSPLSTQGNVTTFLNPQQPPLLVFFPQEYVWI